MFAAGVDIPEIGIALSAPVGWAKNAAVTMVSPQMVGRTLLCD